jgi:hypothetical protein
MTFFVFCVHAQLIHIVAKWAWKKLGLSNIIFISSFDKHKVEFELFVSFSLFFYLNI